MQYIDFEKSLNTKQYEAVSTNRMHVRVVAGAGSGKTRVLTYRIAYLLSEFNEEPWRVLAITFTNKVANEMKSRVVRMIPEAENDLTIKTFHSFAAMFLRREIDVLGFPSSFTIWDEDDQERMVKDIACKEMNFKKNDKIIKRALSYISSKKLKGLYPDDIKIVKPAFEDEKTCLEIYERYEEEKEKALSLDFDDLLLKTNFILENYPLIRTRWRNRYTHILVDEFQDTNECEYRLLKNLKSEFCSLYVVGDPDQTIYTWRGANQNFILKLEDDYPDVETIFLERNYRSTQNILNSANKLISYNKNRLPKNLYTESNKGDPIYVRAFSSGKSEARYVADEILKLVKVQNRAKFSDIVLLYRMSYVTLDFEAAFINAGIPYKIFGGVKFFQRKEIKDVLAYFRLIINPKDNVSFKRIINVPSRKIGEVTQDNFAREAEENNLSLYEYIKNLDDGKASVKSLQAMIKLLEITKSKLESGDDEVLSKILYDLLTDIGYIDYLIKDEEDGEDRIENVKELFSQMRHFLKENPEASLADYLQNIALYSSQDDVLEGDFVTLMTVHTAKGLEFPIVFVVRLNDGVFPHSKALLERGYEGLEEERRLAYVAFTRAKERLYLTFANDYNFTVGGYLTPSQFVNESGNVFVNQQPRPGFIQAAGEPSLFNKIRIQEKQIKEEPKPRVVEDATNGITDWKVGDTLYHKKFGRGKVIGLEGDDIIAVNFDEHGVKSILGTHPFVSKEAFKA